MVHSPLASATVGQIEMNATIDQSQAATTVSWVMELRLHSRFHLSSRVEDEYCTQEIRENKETNITTFTV